MGGAGMSWAWGCRVGEWLWVELGWVTIGIETTAVTINAKAENL
jgi:hypothetical protein